MGLDITAYSNLVFTGDTEYDADDSGDCVFVDNESFPERLEGMPQGYYEKTNSTEEHRFRAGSYSSYGYWRKQLCDVIHGVTPETIWGRPEVFAGKPFYELINMSDCEGSIGTEVCRKLYQDFLMHSDKLKEMEEGSFSAKADDWTEVFRLGSQNGVVAFH